MAGNQIKVPTNEAGRRLIVSIDDTCNTVDSVLDGLIRMGYMLDVGNEENHCNGVIKSALKDIDSIVDEYKNALVKNLTGKFDKKK